MSCSDIDFVVTWVDNSDPQWQNEFEQYKTDTVANEENSHIRYSEHGLLRYWFRGVEKFAPWVRKIHFVTNGQYPAWLNLNNSKLHFVRHSDYIDSKYLPLFNSHPIENNLHRIKDYPINLSTLTMICISSQRQIHPSSLKMICHATRQ